MSVIWSQIREENDTVELHKYGIGDELLNLDQHGFVLVLSLLLSLAAEPMELPHQTDLSQRAESLAKLFSNTETSGNQQNSNQTNVDPKTEGGQDQTKRSGNDLVEEVEKDESIDFEDDEKENINSMQGGEEDKDIDLGIPADIWKPLQLTSTDGSVITIHRLRDDLDETIREKIFAQPFAVFSI